MTRDSPLWQRGTVLPSHGQPRHSEKLAEKVQDKWCHHYWNGIVVDTHRMVYRSSPHAARLFQLYMKDDIKVCLKETLKLLAGSGRYCRNYIFWQKCPGTIQVTVGESCSSDVSSPQHPGDQIITFIGHGLDPARQIWCYQAFRASGCNNNSRKSWDGSTSIPFNRSRAPISGSMSQLLLAYLWCLFIS